VAVGLKLLLFSTMTDEYTGRVVEVEVDLDNPGTDSGPAVAELRADLGNPARVEGEVELLDALLSLVPLSGFRIWCPYPRTWYLDLVPSPSALKNPRF